MTSKPSIVAWAVFNVSIFAYAAAKAETIVQKRWLVAVLANQQIAYFEKTFEARGINADAFDTSLPEVAAFCDGMLTIARDGGYLDTVAAMFSAEWMYWTWSKEAAVCVIGDPLLKEWIDLHAHDDFAAQALWLKAELDTAGETLDASERRRLSDIFGKEFTSSAPVPVSFVPLRNSFRAMGASRNARMR